MSNSKSRSEARLEQPKHMVAPRGRAEQQQQPRSLQILKATDALEKAGVASGQALQLSRNERGGTDWRTKHNKPAGFRGQGVATDPNRTISRIEIADPGRHLASKIPDSGLAVVPPSTETMVAVGSSSVAPEGACATESVPERVDRAN